MDFSLDFQWISRYQILSLFTLRRIIVHTQYITDQLTSLDVTEF